MGTTLDPWGFDVKTSQDFPCMETQETFCGEATKSSSREMPAYHHHDACQDQTPPPQLKALATITKLPWLGWKKDLCAKSLGECTAAVASAVEGSSAARIPSRAKTRQGREEVEIALHYKPRVKGYWLGFEGV